MDIIVKKDDDLRRKIRIELLRLMLDKQIDLELFKILENGSFFIVESDGRLLLNAEKMKSECEIIKSYLVDIRKVFEYLEKKFPVIAIEWHVNEFVCKQTRQKAPTFKSSAFILY